MQQPSEPLQLPAHVHVVDDRAVYSGDDLKRLFRLRPSTLRREIREGRLRVSKRAGRHFFLGLWVRAWIEAGEIKKPTPKLKREAV